MVKGGPLVSCWEDAAKWTNRPRSYPRPVPLRRQFVFVARPTYTPHMSGSDKRKQSLYFPEEMLKEIGAEATRQDRSLSWIVQKAWKAARKDMLSIPSVSDSPGEDDKGNAAK